MVKRILAGIMVLLLTMGNISIPTRAEDISDKEKAIAVIDNLIVELKELEYDKFDSEVLNETLSDSYLWKARYENVKRNIKINNDYLISYASSFYPDGFGSPSYYISEVRFYNNQGDYSYNSYNMYLAELLFFESILETGKIKSINELITDSKKLTDSYDDVNYYLWLYNIALSLNEKYNYDFVIQARKTYIWKTLANVSEKLDDQGHWGENGEYIFYSKSERIDDFVKCLVLLDEELDNPFMSNIDVSVVLNGNTQYDQYQNELNVDKDITQNTNNTNSKTNNSATNNKGTTNSKISVAGKKVSELKLVGKKGKVKVSFAKLQNATSYEIQISTNKKFKKAKTYTVNKTSKTIKKLKRKKTYYVRVRAVSGNTKSKWVKKKIKTK